MSQPQYMTRDQIVAFVNDELGIPLAASTLKQMCMPSVGRGPPVVLMWGRRPLSEREAVRAWALQIARTGCRIVRPPKPTAPENRSDLTAKEGEAGQPPAP
jgi:hypothetical protein